MKRLMKLVLRLRIWADCHGQDLIEYAMIGGFLAVAAGTILPGVATSVSKVFSKVGSTMTAAASQS